ncbi:MAG: ABC transporter ATP-binding protein [Acidobacteriota bacterium]
MNGVDEQLIAFEGVSKFYGEVLGVNRVNLTIASGITSLVGPNGSGKTTLMNLATGLLRPSRGTVRVLGVEAADPETLFRLVGYCSQWDTFPRGLNGYEFVTLYLRLHGHTQRDARRLAEASIERVGMTAAAGRRIAGYSKGMRQRIKLAQAICHQPRVLLLDEPLNGLDPLARAEVISLFRALAAEGLHVVLSSHILHEVDLLSDRIVMMTGGYVVAEGAISGVRGEMEEQRPLQILVRCAEPSRLAARIFEQDHAVEVKIHDDHRGLFVRTRDADGFYALLNRAAVEGELGIEAVAPADEDVHAVYEYLIGDEEQA